MIDGRYDDQITSDGRRRSDAYNILTWKISSCLLLELMSI